MKKYLHIALLVSTLSVFAQSEDTSSTYTKTPYIQLNPEEEDHAIENESMPPQYQSSFFNPNPGCYSTTNSLHIATGYDEINSSVFNVSGNVGIGDLSWIIYNDDDPNTSEPRPAYAVVKEGAWWSALSGSQWVTTYPKKGQSSSSKTYHFSYTFCLEAGFVSPACTFDLRADNEIMDIELNGVSQIAYNNPLSFPIVNSFWDSSPTTVSLDPSDFQTGSNEIVISLYNDGVYMGLNLAGTITTGGSGSIRTYDCCDSINVIGGVVFKDDNEDGIFNNGESVFSGKTVFLEYNNTVVQSYVTDNQGRYNFLVTTPGTYDVTVSTPSGYYPTSPTNNLRTVTVGTHEISDDNNFGFAKIDCPSTVDVEFGLACSGYPTTFEPDISTTLSLSLLNPTFEWDFGDGHSLTTYDESLIRHVYPSTGSYVCTLTTTIPGCSTITTNVPIQHLNAPFCTSCAECIGSFAPEAGQKYVLSAWVKEEGYLDKTTFADAGIRFFYEGNDVYSNTFKAQGPIIDGWQQIEAVFDIPASTSAIQVELINEGTQDVYFDDIRIHPFDANLKSFVYDPITMRLKAELDENNYATFYEYDEDGNLIRTKKETDRGVKTIQETIKRVKQEE